MELFCKLPRSRSMLCVFSFLEKKSVNSYNSQYGSVICAACLATLPSTICLTSKAGTVIHVTDDEPFELVMEICPFWDGSWFCWNLGCEVLWWKSVVVSLVNFFPLWFSLFLTGRRHHQIPSKSIKRGVRFIPTSADTVNIPWTTVIWHDWSQLVQDFVQPLMLHLPS